MAYCGPPGEAPSPIHPLESLLSSDNQDASVTVESERHGSAYPLASQIVEAVNYRVPPATNNKPSLHAVGGGLHIE